jgi:hypothetical protein
MEHLVLGYEAAFLPINHIKQCVGLRIPFLLDGLSDILVVYERHPITKTSIHEISIKPKSRIKIRTHYLICACQTHMITNLSVIANE